MDNIEKSKWIESLRTPLYFVALMWVIHLFQMTLNLDLGQWGIFPRALDGAWGIIFAPLLHADFSHLISNTIPLLVLGSMIFLFYRRIALGSFLMVYILTGVSVWLAGRSVYHIGASGVVYGLVSFVFWMGVFRRSIRSAALAMVVTFLYSGMIMGVLPNQEGISWESHLLGGLVGIFTAYYFKGDLEDDEKKRKAENYALSNPENPAPFLPADIFEKTKKQRQAEAEHAAWLQQFSFQKEIPTPPPNDAPSSSSQNTWFSNTTLDNWSNVAPKNEDKKDETEPPIKLW